MRFQDYDDLESSVLPLSNCKKLEEFVYGAAVKLNPMLLEVLPSTIEHLKVSLLAKDDALRNFLSRQENLRVVSCTFRQPLVASEDQCKLLDDRVIFREGVVLRQKALTFGSATSDVCKSS
jgi:hypothetical protein